jgi:phage terminase large subunit-like protein
MPRLQAAAARAPAARHDRIADALARVRAVDLARERSPLASFSGTLPQLAFWRHPSPRRLFRTGNQVGGKTTAGCVEALWWATHAHPYRRTPTGPVTVLFVCVSWTQSLAIQEKLWRLTPRDQLTPGQFFDPETGFGTKAPALIFKNGSKILIRTENQGAKNLAGSTVHLVIYDEPPKSQRIYSELERRLTRTGGSLCLLMTPINARIDWVRDLAEKGALADLHFRCTPDMFITQAGFRLLLPDPFGDLVPADQAWIDEQRRSCLTDEEPVVIDGEWEMRAKGARFEGFQRSSHVIHGLADAPVGPRAAGLPVRLFLGIDYGDERLRTAAVVVAVYEGRDERDTRVWVLGEYVPERSTNTEMDAEGILRLLGSLGLQWGDLSGAYGDKRYTDASGRMTKKSNGLLSAQVSRMLGNRGGMLVPPVQGAKRQPGAARLGEEGALRPSERWLHNVIMRDNLLVDAACTRLLEAFETYDGSQKHARKDVMDALRYALVLCWGATRRRVAAAPRIALR